MPTLSPATLRTFAQSLFEAAGVPAADAGVVAQSLIDANLCGHDSHGILRLPQYIDFLRNGTYKAGVPLSIINESPAAIAADGNWGLGQVQAHRLLNQLLPKAKSLGVAAGTIRNCGHIGRLGEYAEKTAQEKMLLLAAANSHGSGRRVVPPGGKEGRLSTNPICMGAPTSGDPVVIDFGTSVAAEGKVRAQYQKKEAVPEGWLVDHTGAPTTDPGVLYHEPRGSLLPFGGSQAYKGFGLALLIDIWSGALSGGACANPDLPLAGIGNAVVFVILNPAMFGGTTHFLHEATRLTEFVRNCPTAAGVDVITLPGDPERTTKAQRLSTGIPIPEGTWSLICRTANELQVPIPA
jgi:uncharacterized oxidoreductase